MENRFLPSVIATMLLGASIASFAGADCGIVNNKNYAAPNYGTVPCVGGNQCGQYTPTSGTCDSSSTQPCTLRSNTYDLPQEEPTGCANINGDCTPDYSQPHLKGTYYWGDANTICTPS